GQERPADQRDQSEPQAQGSRPLQPSGSDAEQGADPRAVSERDLPGLSLLWRRFGGLQLFRQVAGSADAGRGGLPGGPAQGADQLSPQALPRGRAGTAELGAGRNGRQQVADGRAVAD